MVNWVSPDQFEHSQYRYCDASLEAHVLNLLSAARDSADPMTFLFAVDETDALLLTGAMVVPANDDRPICLIGWPVARDTLIERELLGGYLEDSRLADSKRPILLLRELNESAAASEPVENFVPLTQVLQMELKFSAIPKERTPSLDSVDLQIIKTSSETSQILDALVRTEQGSRDCPELLQLVDWPMRLADFRKTSGNTLCIYGMFRKDELIGGAITTADDRGASLNLKYLGIVPEYRRQGWGRGFLNSIIHKSDLAKDALIRLEVDVRNNAAIGLYESLGFEISERFELWWEPVS